MNPKTIRALVIEDDPSWQQIITELLEDDGMIVDVANDVVEAVKFLKKNMHRLAIVDLSLSPDDHNNQEGLIILDAIKKMDPNCDSILLTGFATVEVAVSALRDFGAFTFLRKESFQRGQFQTIIRNAISQAPKINKINFHSESSPNSLAQIDIEKQTSEKEIGFWKALVVEDDAGWRSIIEELLIDSRFIVKSCNSFGEAMGILRREKFHLAILDLSLSGSYTDLLNKKIFTNDLEGYQLLTNTRDNHIPTIVVSGISSPEEIKKAYFEQNIFAYIEKQAFERSNFLKIIEDLKSFFSINNDLNTLTEREREVLRLLAKGLTNKEISDNLFITTNTVKRHLKAIFEKLDVHTRSAAASKTMRD